MTKYFRKIKSIFKSIILICSRQWVLQTLKLVPLDSKLSSRQENACGEEDWELVMRETHSLFGRLARCPTPGCQYQKYLRWLVGHPADSAIVRRVLVGVSMLAPTFREMTETSQIKPNRVCFTDNTKQS